VALPKAIDRAIQKAISKGPGKLAKTERAHDSAVYHVQDAEKAIQVRREVGYRDLSILTVATE